MKKLLVIIPLLMLLIIAWLWMPEHEPAPDFSSFSAGAERKTQFLEYMSPLIQQQNALILADRQRLQKLMQGNDRLWWWQRRTLGRLIQKYRMEEFESAEADSWGALLSRVDTIPPSLALAQSAKESGWGTSRFAREGNNFFGQWCYKAGCGLVPKNRSKGANHEVETFPSPEESVASYLLNLNTNRAYKQFRSIRASLRQRDAAVSSTALLAGLVSYSERGDVYVQEVRAMIHHNSLEQYD